MPITRTARRSLRSMLSRNATPRASANHLFKFKQVSRAARAATSIHARADTRIHTYTRKPTRMQHRRERPTPRRQTHPPETPQTHLHPPVAPRASLPKLQTILPSVPRAWRHPNRSPRFANPHHPPYYSPVSSGLTSRSPSPSAFSLSSLTVAALSYTTRLDPTVPIPARHPRPPTYNSYVPERPSSYLQNHPLHSRARRTILLILHLPPPPSP